MYETYRVVSWTREMRPWVMRFLGIVGKRVGFPLLRLLPQRWVIR